MFSRIITKGSRFFRSTGINRMNSTAQPTKIWKYFNKDSKSAIFCGSLLFVGGVGGIGGAGAYAYLDTDKKKFKNLASNFVNENEILVNTKEDIKKRIKTTYGYVLGNLSVTAGCAYAFFKFGFADVVMRSNPFVYLGCFLLVTIPLIFGVMTTDYNKDRTLKHMMLLGLNASLAATLCPIVAVGGSILAQASLATGCVVGGLSLAGFKYDPETFSSLEAPLGIGLGAVVAACIGQMFFPISILQNIALYGGLVVFSGLTMTDTSRMKENAIKHTEDTYDPINESMGIYLDVINMFIRIVTVLDKNKK